MTVTVLELLADALVDTLQDAPAVADVVRYEETSPVPQTAATAVSVMVDGSNRVSGPYGVDDRRTLITVQLAARRTVADRTPAHAAGRLLNAVLPRLSEANASLMARMAPLGVMAINPPEDPAAAAIRRGTDATDADWGAAEITVVVMHRCQPNTLTAQ